MKQTTINRNNKQQGYTIVEILIGVIVAAIVTAGIYAGWNTFYSSNQASTVTSDASLIIQNVQAVYAKSSNGYTGLDTATGIGAGVFPNSIKVDVTNSKVTNGYNGAITLAGLTTGFTLTYAGIPQSACAKILGSFDTSNLLALGTSTTASLWTAGTTAPTGAAIATACTPAKDATTVSMIFTGN